MTRAERRLVSEKIRTLRREGYPPKRAAAIAYSMLRAKKLPARDEPRPIPAILLREVERRGWGIEVSRRLGEREEVETQRARLERILAKIEKRYGVDARRSAESRVKRGTKAGAEWYEEWLEQRKAKTFVAGPPGGFWTRRG